MTDARFVYALEWSNTVRRQGRFPDEVLDAAHDGLVDALLARSDLGALCGAPSRRAVFALGSQQIKWRHAEYLRRRRYPDGRPRLGPGAAASLDAPEPGGTGRTLADRVAGPDDLDERIDIQERCRRLLEAIAAADPITGLVMAGYASGCGPKEIGAAIGMDENAVAQRKRRFLNHYGS